MVTCIIETALRQRFLVVVITLLVIGLGLYSLRELPIDAVPDLTNIQVQIITTAPALSPTEVERYLTFPVEAAMSGLPGITEVRSISKYGLSVVTVVFRDEVDIYFARQLVAERLREAEKDIPPMYGRPEMGPISTGMGEIYHFVLRGEGHSLMELETILDWYVAYQLRSVPGVVEVNSFGGEEKQYQVQIDPRKLVAYGIPLPQVFEALERNSTSAGGGYIEHNREQYVIKSEALVGSLEDIGNIIVANGKDGVPIYVKNLGTVTLGPRLRRGAATQDGKGEVVLGIAMMLRGENSRVVVGRVKAKMAEIQKGLPPGVIIEPFYDRADLVNRTIHTVVKNLTEGGLLVIAVLFLLLGNLQGGLIVASAIPLSMLIAFTGMIQAGISGNLMSLGAIDFGLIVDGAVVIVENVLRRLARVSDQRADRVELVREAAREVGRPIGFAVGIIIIVYLPILTLQGIEGKLFKPMAYTVIFALTGSLLLSLTLIPVLSSLLLSRPVREETRIIEALKKYYMPLLYKAVTHPVVTAATAATLFAGSLCLVPFLGAEFIPQLDEGSIAIGAFRLPSVSLSQAVEMTHQAESVLKEFPEVETVVSRTGSPEVATDPMGTEMSDVYVMLKPCSEWVTTQDKEELVERMERTLKERVPGMVFSFSQPIELRVSELIAGVRSDVAVKIFGEDLEVLREKAEEVARVLSRVRGARDVKVEQVAGLPTLRIRIDREKAARHGINAADIHAVVEASAAGREVGKVFEGQKRFDLVVKLPSDAVRDPSMFQNLPVTAHDGLIVPLGQVAEVAVEEGPAQVSRENIQRRIVVEVNVRGRDLVGFVREAQRLIEQKVDLPPGYFITWGGQFEYYLAARRRLALAVPLALFLIFVLLYGAFNSIRPALLIFLNVPFAATGGILALFLRSLPFSISAGVGFIALFGVAVLNGVVLMSYILQMRQEGMGAEEAALRGAEIRLRPVLMTALVASLGFVPMALSTSAGAEVQRPLATVVIGGLVTSTALTLLVLPTLYAWIEGWREVKEID